MMYGDYLSFGGIEIANSARAKGYAESADCPVHWIKTEACPSIVEVLGDLPYTADNVGSAPWYDPTQPELSSRFFGVVIVGARGLSDSTRSLTVSENMNDGGTISGQRRETKRVRYRLALLARGEDALDYGLTWLSSALDGDKCGTHGDRCGTTDLQFFTDCPPAIYDYFETSRELEATNYFTNPNLLGDGTYVEVARNHFTNPELVGDGTWAEVRRNLVENPSFEGSLFDIEDTWYFSTTGALSYSLPLRGREGGKAFRFDINEGATGKLRTKNYASASALRGRPVTMSAYIRHGDAGEPRSISSELYWIGASGQSVKSDPVVAPEGDWTRISLTAVVPEAANGIYAQFHVEDGPLSGSTLFDDVMLEVSDLPTPYFDGSTTPETAEGVVQPEDFRWRFVGAENASESVMEGRNIPSQGFSAVGCFGVESTLPNGDPAVRIISTQSGGGYFGLRGVAVGDVTTGIITVHIKDDPPPPTTTTLRTIASANENVQLIPSSSYPGPGETKSYRAVLDKGPGGMIVLRNSSLIGGSTWYAQAGVFTGDYTRDWKGSSDLSEVYKPEDFRTRWTGTENASAMVLEGEQVRGVVADMSPAIVSTWEGEPAIRSIPSKQPSGIIGSTVQFNRFDPDLPLTTFMATVGSNNEKVGDGYAGLFPSRALFWTYGNMESVIAPPEPGTYPLALKIDAAATSVTMLGDVSDDLELLPLMHDTWFSSIGEFEGDYDGPWFTGDTPDTDTEKFEWLGEPNDSPSVMYVTENEYLLDREATDAAMLERTRFMHDVAVSSGPLLVEEYESNGTNMAVVEVDFLSERGYVYSPPRGLNLSGAELSSATDIGINYAPNPRSRRVGTQLSSIVRNAVRNPSFETNLTDWSVVTPTKVTPTRPFQEARVVGDYSLKMEGSENIFEVQVTIPAAARSAAPTGTAGVWVALIGTGTSKAPVSARLTIAGQQSELVTQNLGGTSILLEDVNIPATGNVIMTVQATFTGTGTATLYVDAAMLLMAG